MRNIIFNKVSKQLKATAFLASVLMLSACGKTGFVQSSKVKTFQQNGDLFATVSSTVNLNGMVMASATVPIYDPKDPTTALGQLSMQSDLSGNNNAEIGITVNLTKVAGLQGLGHEAVLPNGTPIPVAGYDTNDVMQFSVGGSATQVYTALNETQKEALVGVAIPVKQLDNALKYIGGANIFPMFTLGNGVRGVFGVFTGLQNGQNGFALFLDVSSLLYNDSGAHTLSSAWSKSISESSINPISFVSKMPSTATQNAVDYQLYWMSKRHTRLTPH